MLGIQNKIEFGTFLTRNYNEPVEFIDALNAPDIFADGIIPEEFTISDIGGIDSNGNWINEVINSNLDTQTKKILGEFIFESSGALKMATDSNNGLWLSPTGILGKKAGATTFAIDTSGNATFGGTLVAASGTFGTITSGTIKGVSFLANGGTGTDIQIDNTGKISFKYGGTVKSYMYVTTSGQTIIDADTLIWLRADGAGDDIWIEANDLLSLDCGSLLVQSAGSSIFHTDNWSIWYNDDNDGSDCYWISNGTTKMKLDSSGDLSVWGDITNTGNIRCGGTFVSSGGNTGDTTTEDLVTSVWWDAGTLKYNYRTFTFSDGVMTNKGAEQTTTA